MSKEKDTRLILELDYSAEAKAGNFDPLITFFHHGASMILNARAIREKKSKSYRGVLVGAALLANNTEERKQRIFVGWNETPFKGASKFCAEMRAINAAFNSGYFRREAIIVPGVTDPKIIQSITGLPTRILPPCEPCREILADDTLVMSVGGNEDIYDAFTGKLLRSERHLLAPKGARPRQITSTFEQPPIFDLGKLNWAHAEEAYRELTSNLVGDSIYEEDLRLARANVAAQVLRDPDYLIAA
jgi:cytidine deaminase